MASPNGHVSNDEAEPLHSCEGMAELSKKLGLLERVRHVCQAVAIPLPGVVVVGEQSAGKSSLLENISGIQFPRAQNTCTRMPCVLTMLTDPAVEESLAMVSMDPSFEAAEKCSVSEVEGKIKALTDVHATGDKFISGKALYVRVVRNEGPQLSLIDLPGVTHNADKMANIHEVTVKLVQDYIAPEEMVILCVIPAMSDFGNAEVVKLARHVDPEGKRTLGVVTKCDDAAMAESSDIVEKVLMRRETDVQLKLGFHCVVNRSQKNIEDGMLRKDLWEKEQALFEANDRLQSLPRECWGTLRLMEKVAQIQANRVDECLPKIKEAVRSKLLQLRDDVRALPAQAETEADQYRLFNGILRQVNEDLQRKVRAEFMSSTPSDRDLAIAPKVASMIQDFRNHLLMENPDWLGGYMIDEVTDTVETFVHGYTVDNLTGPQVFINLIKRTFIEEGLLKEAVDNLVDNVAEHLRKVVKHVVALHADINNVLANRLAEKAEDVIEERLQVTRDLCNSLAIAQQVTSTTHGGYMVKLTKFRKSWIQEAAENVQSKLAQTLLGSKFNEPEEEAQLTPEFLEVVKQAQEEPQKLAVLEICASLHVYTGFLIEGFVEMASKLVKFNMVEELAAKLEEHWREHLAGSNLHELFPKDRASTRRRQELNQQMDHLQEFKDELSKLKVAAPMLATVHSDFGKRKRLGQKAKEATEALAAAAEAEAKAKMDEVAARTYIWNVADETKGKTLEKGALLKSPAFSKGGVPDMHLMFYPAGHSKTDFIEASHVESVGIEIIEAIEPKQSAPAAEAPAE